MSAKEEENSIKEPKKPDYDYTGDEVEGKDQLEEKQEEEIRELRQGQTTNQVF
jgi:hypothetical protein